MNQSFLFEEPDIDINIPEERKNLYIGSYIYIYIYIYC